MDSWVSDHRVLLQERGTRQFKIYRVWCCWDESKSNILRDVPDWFWEFLQKYALQSPISIYWVAIAEKQQFCKIVGIMLTKLVSWILPSMRMPFSTSRGISSVFANFTTSDPSPFEWRLYWRLMLRSRFLWRYCQVNCMWLYNTACKKAKETRTDSKSNYHFTPGTNKFRNSSSSATQRPQLK